MTSFRSIPAGMSSLVLVIQFALALAAPRAASARPLAIEPPVCAGDCNGDDDVTVDELVSGVRIVLELEALAGCAALDADGDSRVTINELLAAVNHLLEGCPLPAVCGGIAGLPCGRGEFCELPTGACRIPDIGGMCVPVTTACPALFMPVCGCDGATYGNDCERQAARISKDYDGACDKRCGGLAGSPCESGEFCDFPAGSCGIADIAGVCAEVPRLCTRIYAPVCGCNRVTYGNDCVRRVAQVTKDHEGVCEAPQP